jgi:hypothetical protein
VVWFAFNETKMNQFLAVWVAKVMVVELTIALPVPHLHPLAPHLHPLALRLA